MLAKTGIPDRDERFKDRLKGSVTRIIRFDHKNGVASSILDGEELVEAKQNRIVNASFLIAGNQRSQSREMDCLASFAPWREIG